MEQGVKIPVKRAWRNYNNHFCNLIHCTAFAYIVSDQYKRIYKIVFSYKPAIL